MNKIKVIITGTTGMVGEGVLFECLENPAVAEILSVSRRSYELKHPKFKELIVPDFFQLTNHIDLLRGYDACFFCAGVSSVGMKEDKYTYLTYDTTLAFAKVLSEVNHNMVFTYVSGMHTDSSEKGNSMWARVKGKTENDLMKLPFKGVYNFRPGAMFPFNGQKNWKSIYKAIVKVIKVFTPKSILTMQEVGRAMIYVTTEGYDKSILEIVDIKELAHR
ncbi:NAD-dependent epimerase/dehydratase family protein [Solitalea lacus]|uniref:NAD-dependent epimerase/dehydratase family protein n=1 Tax=Solitalea lacus TaxID=2911172 RepID=UPI001EDA71D9|nr:NAD-dependent epimerase/dehydratase family protein [Solitalea lacus]UKJ08968.1 NAD-dependent epimerase/dehydratase family protein [Solitalea lacus]